MAERIHLDWFRRRLELSLSKEPRDIQPLLNWREERIRETIFSPKLIPLKDVRDWYLDEGGNVRHKSGQFFSVEGIRTEAGEAREVRSWDQPIFTQLDGGVLAMVARETSEDGVQFLLQGRVEPGNIGPVQLSASLQGTWSNIRRAHQGNSPPLTELLTAQDGVKVIYRALHNEEGGRFWKKSNENIVLFVENHDLLPSVESFCWASATQIKELGLVDNVLSPYVKTVMAPL